MQKGNKSNKKIIVHPSGTDRIKAEVAEILSPENRKRAQKRVKHEPSRGECFREWEISGGGKRFRATHLVRAVA